MNATIANPNKKKSTTDYVLLYLKPPQADNTPNNCIDFSLNLNVPFYQSSSNEVTVILEGKNATDIVIKSPNVNIDRCAAKFSRT